MAVWPPEQRLEQLLSFITEIATIVWFQLTHPKFVNDSWWEFLRDWFLSIEHGLKRTFQDYNFSSAFQNAFWKGEFYNFLRARCFTVGKFAVKKSKLLYRAILDNGSVVKRQEKRRQLFELSSFWFSLASSWQCLNFQLEIFNVKNFKS